jgi:hypothetical protein
MFRTLGFMIGATVLGICGAVSLASSREHLAMLPQAEGPRPALSFAAAPLRSTPVATPAVVQAPLALETASEAPAAVQTPAAPVSLEPVSLEPVSLAAPALASTARPLPRPQDPALSQPRLSSQSEGGWQGSLPAPVDALPRPYVSPYAVSAVPAPQPDPALAQAVPPTAPARRMPVGAVDFNPWKTGVYR